MNKYTERLYNGLIKENPTFVLMLGMCPTLAVTTSAINGIGMGLSTTVVLVLSNMLISMLRKIIPDSVRMPAFIVVVASFVTIVQFLMEGFVPSLYDSLGIYIPLIVVNCIILGRAESYASKLSLIHIFKHLEMTITGLRSYKEAIITKGGVSVKEIDPGTMESKKVEGLYFVGEVLDLDALTGGFNLQIAWSTAVAAGNAIPFVS